MKRSVSAVLFVASFLAAVLYSPVCRAGDTGEAEFFSAGRFVVDPGKIDNSTDSDLMRRNLKEFYADFKGAQLFLSAGKIDEAQEKLFQARTLWPEFYGTDFLLALSFERKGDVGTAARFYKSYLDKLYEFHVGAFRVSSPIIRFITVNDIERYEAAEDLVRTRLAASGIDIDRVKPVVMVPNYYFYFTLVGLFFVLLVLAVNLGVPYYRRARKMRNPPEGFWVCKHCGSTTPLLSGFCHGCGRGRD